jgi:hypothetical protein
MAISNSWTSSHSGTVQTPNGAGAISDDSSKSKPGKIFTVVVHQFKIYEFDDPVMEASEELLRWERSEAGQWVMERAIETPIWHKNENYAMVCVDFVIVAKLKEQHYTYWMLKWGSG